MPDAQPADAVALAYNQALALSGDQVPELERLAWHLQGLYRRRQNDTIAGLGLMHAAQMLGRREEALALSDELYGRRAGMTPYERLALANLEADIGHYDRSLELADFDAAMLPMPLRWQQQQIHVSAALICWITGLIDEEHAKPWSFFPFLTDLKVIGLLPVMQERQDLVNGLLIPVQCSSEATVGTDGEGGLRMTRVVYAALDYAERRALAERLADALSDFYGRHGIDEGGARDLAREVILPVTARPSALAAPSLLAA